MIPHAGHNFVNRGDELNHAVMHCDKLKLSAMRERLIVAVLGICAFGFVRAAQAAPALQNQPAVSATAKQTTNPAQSQTSAPPGNSELDAALRLYRTGQFDAALTAYQALTSGPQAAAAYAGLARTYLKLRDPANAAAAVNKAVELAPEAPDAQVALGEVDFREGKLADSEAIFVKVINSGAQNARAYLGLARISQAASLFARGKKMIDVAHTLDPKDPDIQRMWISTLTIAERIKALRDYLALDSDDDAEERVSLQGQLLLLQDTEDQPSHPCRMTSSVTSTQMQLRQLLIDSNHLRGYGLDVKFNGAGAHLMLDTGAGGILIDKKVAEKAGVKKLAEVPVRGIGDKGPVAGYVGQVDKIDVGDLEFQDCRVQVIETNSAAGEDGLIGGTVFANFLVDVNFPDGKFALSPLPTRPDEATPQTALDSSGNTTAGAAANANTRFHDRYIAPEMKSYARIYRVGHMLLIPTWLNEQATPKLFLIDTGALTSLISIDAAREVTHVSTDDSVRMKGLNGDVKQVFSSNELTLTFGSFRQKTMGLTAMNLKPLSDNAGTEISGILGFTVLRMLDMKIDYRDGLIGFTYNANRWDR